MAKSTEQNLIAIMDRAKEILRKEWWKGFWVGAVGAACLMFVFLAALFFMMVSTNSDLQAGLVKCREISQTNYTVATAAQEENRQLRAMVVEYQAQIQKGQAPANLAEFLLKLLVK